MQWRDDDSLKHWHQDLVANARAQGRDPDPRKVARAEGRRVEPGEIEAWEQRLGITEYLDLPLQPRSSERSRSFPSSPSSRHPAAPRRPRWYLRSADETSARRRSGASESARGAPELRETGSGFTVALSASVATAIEQEVLRAIWEFDSLEIETGGYLYGLYPPDDGGVLIAHASGPGSNGTHGAGQVLLSEPTHIEAGFSDVLARAGLVRVGDWHSHPSRDPEPSPKDLSAWARHSDVAGVLPYAGLIVTPGAELGWTCPDFCGWVTREDENLLVCEPGRVAGL